MRNGVLIVLTWLFVSMPWSGSLSWARTDAYLDVLRQGVVLSQVGRWEQAADHWAKGRTALDATEGMSDQDLALLGILQAMALEKTGNAQAYEVWTDALAAFLKAGTRWEDFRATLAGHLRGMQISRGSTFSTEGVITADQKPGDLILSSLDSLLQFTTYDGPAPGLQPVQHRVEEPLTVARSYFPRPPAILAEDNSTGPRGRTISAPQAGEGERSSSRVMRGVPEIGPDELSSDPTQNQSKTDEFSAGSGALNGESAFSMRFPPARSGAEGPSGMLSGPTLSRRLDRRSAGALSEADRDAARRAWRYIVMNRQSNTGLVNSVQTYPYTTMWDLGSSIAAIVSAFRIGIIDEWVVEDYLDRMLRTLSDIPLYDGVLPNREYDTRSAMMTDLRNRQSSVGSGYSSIDVARLLVWLAVIKEHFDTFAERVESIVSRWDLTRVHDGDEFYRELLTAEGIDRKQEGRMGYEQYTALAFAHWGIVVPGAHDTMESRTVRLHDIPILKDTRTPNHLNLEPFLLALMEFETRMPVVETQAARLLAAHVKRYEDTGILSLYTEDSIDQAPWFLYNTVLADAGPWRCLTSAGKEADRCQRLSTKAAFAAEAVFDLDYTRIARQQVIEGVDMRRGYYAGIYEDGTMNRVLTVNTNAIILEALAFKAGGSRAFLANAYADPGTATGSRAAR